MKTTMDLTTEFTCPVDGIKVPITITIQVGMYPLMVEDLLELIAEVQQVARTQEEVTGILHHRLEMPVKTVGVHSGVTITCET